MGARTVQGDIESALGRILNRPDVNVAVAGRTDAGVHALGQVMSVQDVPDAFEPLTLRNALNAMCGPAISIWECRRAEGGFHARFSARSRMYIYAILVAEVSDPFLAPTTLHHPEPLDLDAMNEAAGHLLGRHDFSSFGRVPDGSTAERALFELEAQRAGSVVRIRARANAFIQQMVRSLAGTLIRVGEGRLSADDVPGILDCRDRSAAGPVSPPHGLCLVSIEYDEGWSRPPNALLEPSDHRHPAV